MSDAMARHPSTTAPSSVAVVDVLGGTFERLRELAMPVSLSHLTDPRRLTTRRPVDGIVYAAYAPLDWEMVAQVSSHGPALIVTTTYERSEAEEALRWGLLGYLDAALADAPFERAVHGALLRGEPGFSRDVIGAWMRELRRATGAREGTIGRLTLRQREILTLVAYGKTDKEIAAKLGIATTTAQKHVTGILQRLGVPNRAAAVATAHSGGPSRLDLRGLATDGAHRNGGRLAGLPDSLAT